MGCSTALEIDPTSQLFLCPVHRALKTQSNHPELDDNDPTQPPAIPTHYLNYKQSWMGVVSHILSEEDNHSIDTWKQNVVEVTITCSNKLNENDIETMERKIEMVTNVKEYDEAHIPIVRNRSLDLEDGANLTYV